MAGTKPSRAPLSRRSERLKRRRESTLSHESQPDGDDNEKNTEEGTPEPPPVPRRKRRKKDDSDSDPDDADSSSPEPAKRHGKSAKASRAPAKKVPAKKAPAKKAPTKKAPKNLKPPKKSAVIEHVMVDDEVADEIEEVENGMDSEDEAEKEKEGDVDGDDVDEDLDDEPYDDGLLPGHRIVMPKMKMLQRHKSRDINLMFSHRHAVNFKSKGGESTVVEGRWCLTCRADEKSVKKYGVRKAFLTGWNSTCRHHCRAHFDVYKEKCKEANLPLHHHAFPREIWATLTKKGRKAKEGQGTLQFKKVDVAKEFSEDGILHAVTQFVVCDDQALAIVNKPVFRNCLVAMRPRTRTKELPSIHGVETHIHNEFVKHLDDLQKRIKAAPGKVSVTGDGWTADKMGKGFFGMTGHWIDVEKEVSKSGAITQRWTLQSAVLGFRGIAGGHDGENLGRYFMGITDRAGITGKDFSKLYGATLDNASNNGTGCQEVEQIHEVRGLPEWSATENKIPCLGHVVNLGNVAFVGTITKIAAVENTNAIWEFDPNLPDSRVLNGDIDVIAAVRTLAIKIQSSPQRVEFFEQIQQECGIKKPLKIPLPSNVRWGTAYKMLDRILILREAIDNFVSRADRKFGPATTLRKNGRIVKHIPWKAFEFSDQDWQRVDDVREILEDTNAIQQHFSSEKEPTLWRIIPAIEDLLSAWEDKLADPRFELYSGGLQDGIDKINKYYCSFDRNPAILCSVALHPHLKLEYIKLKWGGPEEQAKEIAEGNFDAKDWQDEAKKTIEVMMEKYWKLRETTTTPKISPARPPKPRARKRRDEFEEHLEKLAASNEGENEGGWRAELRDYLRFRPAGVHKHMDVIKWWADNAEIYPTLARIALDILAIPASSVPCERLFSAAKLIATDRRTCLGAERFEELQIMKSTWRNQVGDIAAWNAAEVEEVDMGEFEELLADDVSAAAWDQELRLTTPISVVSV